MSAGGGLPVSPDAWVVATNNAQKLKEIAAILQRTGVSLCRPADLGVVLDVEEWGETFAVNAALKAAAFARHTGRVALADDSGLEVDALGGAPGVQSARYSGEGATDARNNAALCSALADLDETAPAARFRCTIAVAWPAHLGPVGPTTPTTESAVEPGGPFVLPDGVVLLLVTGTLEGTVSPVARGANGFGYDPHFVLPDGRHLAELASEEKNALSHRARALQALLPTLAGLGVAARDR